MGEKDDVGGKAGDIADARSEPFHFTLSPEERGVLINCRRHSMIRGAVSGSGFCMLIYWLKAQGRVPTFVLQYPSLVYGLGFFGAFVAGANSYRKICVQKILSLENSPLAEEYRKSMTKIGVQVRNERRKDSGVDGSKRPPKEPSPYPSSRPKPPPQLSPLPAPPNVKLDEGPSINMRSYNRDRSMLETKEEEREQPSAFSGGDDRAPVLPHRPPVPPQQTPRGGRTFDEIREENRLRHGQPSYPVSPQAGSTSGGEKRKRRNKYGDIIED